MISDCEFTFSQYTILNFLKLNSLSEYEFGFPKISLDFFNFNSKFCNYISHSPEYASEILNCKFEYKYKDK